MLAGAVFGSTHERRERARRLRAAGARARSSSSPAGVGRARRMGAAVRRDRARRRARSWASPAASRSRAAGLIAGAGAGARRRRCPRRSSLLAPARAHARDRALDRVSARRAPWWWAIVAAAIGLVALAGVVLASGTHRRAGVPEHARAGLRRAGRAHRARRAAASPAARGDQPGQRAGARGATRPTRRRCAAPGRRACGCSATWRRATARGRSPTSARTWTATRAGTASTAIFLDETAHTADLVAHYWRLAQVVRGDGAGLVVLNPGVVPATGYFAFADVVVTFEGPADEYAAALARTPAWLADVPRRSRSRTSSTAPRASRPSPRSARAPARGLRLHHLRHAAQPVADRAGLPRGGGGAARRVRVVLSGGGARGAEAVDREVVEVRVEPCHPLGSRRAPARAARRRSR